MKTLTFEDLKGKLGIGLAVVICEKMLSEVFFKDLELNDWLEIYQESKPGSDLEQRALSIIKESLRRVIKSPVEGTLIATDTSEEPLLVKVGDHVEPDTVVCKIETIKVQKEIKAGVCGTITKVLAKHGDAVDYGQTLFEVKPDL